MKKTAQDYIWSWASGEAIAGFNRRLRGDTFADITSYPDRPNLERCDGWQLADGMIRDGKIFSLHNFHRSHEDCEGYALPYGGSHVCNTCERSHLGKPWWIIKVYQDGNAWCCVGEDFEDLQASDNFAFGDTREVAIRNYGDIMIKQRAEA